MSALGYFNLVLVGANYGGGDTSVFPVKLQGGHKCLPVNTTGGTQVSSRSNYRGGTQVSSRSNYRGGHLDFFFVFL